MASPGRTFVVLVSLCTWTSAMSDANNDDELMAKIGREEEKGELLPELLPLSPAQALTPTAGCQLADCIGTMPVCGGNAADCTALGLSVLGYVNRCPGDNIPCLTGQKVQCELCPSTVPAPPVTAAPLPTVAPPWVAPTNAPQATPAPVTAAPVVLPTGAPQFTAAPYNPYGVSNATLAHKLALGNVSLWKTAYANASKELSTCEFNVSHFTRLEKRETKASEDLRSDGVVRAQKVALANITKGKVMKAMNSAFFAQKGAATSAQGNLIRMNNAEQAKMYYKQELVDVREQRRQMEKTVRIAQIQVKKAMSDLRSAKRAEQRHHYQSHSLSKRARMAQNSNIKIAERLSVEQEMEKAYEEASMGRHMSNVPPLGQNVFIPNVYIPS